MKMKNQDFLESFLDHLKEEGKSKGTIEGYGIDIRGFFKFYKKDIRKIAQKDINDFKGSMISNKRATATINRKLISVKRFIDFSNEHFDLGINIKIKMEKETTQYALEDEKLLTFSEYRRIVEAAEKAGDIRTVALLETMYYTGMRVSEALQMRIDHTDKTVIKDIIGKGGKKRPIYINSKLKPIINEYMKARKQPYSSNTKLLFVGERGPMTRQTAHHLIKKYAKIAGVEASKAHVHNLRHLFGLRLAEKNKPIQEIAKYMGHSNMEITRIYLEKSESEYAEGLEVL